MKQPTEVIYEQGSKVKHGFVADDRATGDKWELLIVPTLADILDRDAGVWVPASDCREPVEKTLYPNGA